MRKTIAFILSICLLLTLAACGDSEQGATIKGAPKNDEVLITIGDYGIRYKGYEITKDENGNDSIVLSYDFINNSEYACAFGWNIFSSASQGTSELDSAYILVPNSSEEVTAAILDNVEPGKTLEVKSAYVLANTTDDVIVTLSDFDHTTEEKLTVQLEGIPTASVAEEPTMEEPATEEITTAEPQTTEEPTQLTDYTQWWDGDWYGWWMVRNCEGAFAENNLEGMYWDCCAEVKVNGDGTASLLIWDEDLPKEDPLAKITLLISKDYGDGEMGGALTESGYFLDMEIEHADFYIDPAQYDYENFFVMSGWYESADSSCYIELFMRPWGQDWSDVSTTDHTMPYQEMLPGYYADWYLPAIQAGKEMPDVIGGDFD